MPLYKVLDPAGILILTPAAQQRLPAGAVCYLSAPPTIPFGGNPAVYPGWGPPARQSDPWYVRFSKAGQLTAYAIAAGRIQAVPTGTAVTPPPPPPGGPLGLVVTGTWNNLIFRALNGQPGLHVAVSN